MVNKVHTKHAFIKVFTIFKLLIYLKKYLIKFQLIIIYINSFF